MNAANTAVSPRLPGGFLPERSEEDGSGPGAQQPITDAPGGELPARGRAAAGRSQELPSLTRPTWGTGRSPWAQGPERSGALIVFALPCDTKVLCREARIRDLRLLSRPTPPGTQLLEWECHLLWEKPATVPTPSSSALAQKILLRGQEGERQA